MQIRLAEERDLPELLAIYNEEVLHGTATFDVVPLTLEERMPWLKAHNVDNHPLITAVDDDGHLMGYASLSSYRPKDAYRTTVELSVYVARSDRRKGVASAMMTELLAMAEADPNTHLVVSVITSGNEASQKLHQRFGFTWSGTVPETGMKFGEWMGIETYWKRV